MRNPLLNSGCVLVAQVRKRAGTAQRNDCKAAQLIGMRKQ